MAARASGNGGVSINGDTPIAGWLISWKIPEMDDWGTPHDDAETSLKSSNNFKQVVQNQQQEEKTQHAG